MQNEIEYMQPTSETNPSNWYYMPDECLPAIQESMQYPKSYEPMFTQWTDEQARKFSVRDEGWVGPYKREGQAFGAYIASLPTPEAMQMLTDIVEVIMNSHYLPEVAEAIGTAFDGYGNAEWAEKLMSMAALEEAMRPETDDEPEEGAPVCPHCGKSNFAILNAIDAFSVNIQTPYSNGEWMPVSVVSEEYDESIRSDGVMCLNCEHVFDPNEGEQPIIPGWDENEKRVIVVNEDYVPDDDEGDPDDYEDFPAFGSI